MPSIDRLSVWSEVVYISKGYKGLDPLGLRVLQKLCSESPLLVPRPGVPFVGKKQYKTKGKHGQVLSRLWYHLSYTVLSFQCNGYMFNFYKASCWLQFTAYSWNNRCVRMSGSKVTSGAPNGKFWGKRPQNNNKVWIKLSEVIFSILGDCWKKWICSSLPAARLTEEFPASKVHLQPATWLTVGGGGGGN